MTDNRAPTAVPVPPPWKRDFPYEAVSEEEVTRREFARYLVLGAGTIAVANVGIAVWTQLRSINTGEPRAIVAAVDVAVGEPFLFSYPGNDDPAILAPPAPIQYRIKPHVKTAVDDEPWLFPS